MKYLIWNFTEQKQNNENQVLQMSMTGQSLFAQFQNCKKSKKNSSQKGPDESNANKSIICLEVVVSVISLFIFHLLHNNQPWSYVHELITNKQQSN